MLILDAFGSAVWGKTRDCAIESSSIRATNGSVRLVLNIILFLKLNFHVKGNFLNCGAYSKKYNDAAPHHIKRYISEVIRLMKNSEE